MGVKPVNIGNSSVLSNKLPSPFQANPSPEPTFLMASAAPALLPIVQRAMPVIARSAPAAIDVAAEAWGSAELLAGGAGAIGLGGAVALGSVAIAAVGVLGLVVYNEMHGGAADVQTWWGDALFDWTHPDENRPVTEQDIDLARRRLRARQLMEMLGIDGQQANLLAGLDGQGNLIGKVDTNPVATSNITRASSDATTNTTSSSSQDTSTITDEERQAFLNQLSSDIFPYRFNNITDIEPRFRRDRLSVLALMDRHPRFLEDLDPEFSDDKEIVLAAVKKYGLILRHVSPALRADPEVVLAAIRQNGAAFPYAHYKLRSNREFLLSAIQINPCVFSDVDPTLKDNFGFIKDAVQKNGWVFIYLSPDLQRNPSIAVQLARINIQVLEAASGLDDRVKNEIWRELGIERDWVSLLPAENLQNYESWKEGLKRYYDTEVLGRLRSLEVLREVVALRKSPEAFSPKPFAIVELPKSDWNRAFNQYPMVDRLVELGYQVFYFEAGNKTVLNERLFEATLSGQKQADLIVLGGHGSVTTLSLGGRDLGFLGAEEMRDPSQYIHIGDFGETPAIPLMSFIKPTGDVLLYSCSNGAGRECNPNNLANTIRRDLPEGVTIYATDQSTNIKDISRDPSGRLNITWNHNSLYTVSGQKQ